MNHTCTAFLTAKRLGGCAELTSETSATMLPTGACGLIQTGPFSSARELTPMARLLVMLALIAPTAGKVFFRMPIFSRVPSKSASPSKPAEEGWSDPTVYEKTRAPLDEAYVGGAS